MGDALLCFWVSVATVVFGVEEFPASVDLTLFLSLWTFLLSLSVVSEIHLLLPECLFSLIVLRNLLSFFSLKLTIFYCYYYSYFKVLSCLHPGTFSAFVILVNLRLGYVALTWEIS